jgi:hypothetical protein
MKKLFRVPLSVEATQLVRVRNRFKTRCVLNVDNTPTLIYEGDTEEPWVSTKIYVTTARCIGTYIGTLKINKLIWHFWRESDV